MGNRPSSRFGFGVALKQNANLGDSDEPGTPYRLMSWGETDENGVTIVSSGYCDEPFHLVVIRDSVSASDDWMPQALAPEKVARQPEWSTKIEAFLDRWGLRSKVAKGFEKPSFIHAPYYG